MPFPVSIFPQTKHYLIIYSPQDTPKRVFYLKVSYSLLLTSILLTSYGLFMIVFHGIIKSCLCNLYTQPLNLFSKIFLSLKGEDLSKRGGLKKIPPPVIYKPQGFQYRYLTLLLRYLLGYLRPYLRPLLALLLL